MVTVGAFKEAISLALIDGATDTTPLPPTKIGLARVSHRIVSDHSTICVLMSPPIDNHMSNRGKQKGKRRYHH
jgi:hypothetical protein